MAPKFSPKILAATKTFARLAAAIVALEGLLVLIGWQTDVALLKSLDRSFVAMNPVSAVLFAASGVVLGTLLSRRASPRIRLAAKVAGLVVAAIGALKIASYLFPWNFGLDQLLFHDQVIASGNQVAPNTAFEFLLIGLGLSQIDAETSRGGRPAQGLALVALTLALFATFGYVYHAHALFGVGQNIPMSLPSAIGFALVSAGILAAHPDRGAMATLCVDSAGGRMARRLLPAAVGVPALLGWLRVVGENARIYDTALGIALLVVLTIVFLTALVWYNARWLNQNDLRRQQIELQLEHAKDAAEAGAAGPRRRRSGARRVHCHGRRRPHRGLESPGRDAPGLEPPRSRRPVACRDHYSIPISRRPRAGLEEVLGDGHRLAPESTGASAGPPSGGPRDSGRANHCSARRG